MDLTNTNAVTMSSREIAELVGATHDNVLKTVRSLIAKGVVSSNETPYTHPQNGQKYMEFRLGYRDTMVVVSGYSVEHRARIIDRWQELEAQVAQPVINLNDPAFLRTTLLAYTEKVIALEAKVTADAPKVEFHDKYTKAEGNKGIREVAKLLHANEREFVGFLIARDFMYRLHGRLTPHAHHHHAGRFDVKAGVSNNDHAFNQAMFTPKGVAWIAAEWGKFQSAVPA